MPSGYLVTLGDTNLDAGDIITDPLVSFTTVTAIGAGQWTWSGTFGGTTYTNELETGQYYEATDGNVYFVPDFGAVTTITSADVTSAPAYSTSNGIVTGTGSADLIDASFTDADGDGDQVGTGDDTINAGAGDDTIIGGAGADTIDGGTGSDTASYAGSASGVSVNLSSGTNTGGDAEGDVLSDIENVTGSSFDDTLTGDTADNVLDGAGGADQIDGGDGNDTILGGAGNDAIYGGGGTDTLQGGAGNDTIYGGNSPDGTSVGTGGTNTLSDTFTVISLGTTASIDVDETDGGISELAANLLGTYGGPGSELYNELQTAVTNDTNLDTNINDGELGGTPEDIVIDGITYQLDGTVVYNATVTFVDGTTGTFTAVVFQATTGEVFMAPEYIEAADNALLTSLPIESITLDSVLQNNTAIVAARLDADYRVPADPPVDDSDDLIDGGAGDDIIYGGGGNDTIAGGTGSDTVSGGDGDDTITVAQGDIVTGGDGDDTFNIVDLGEAGSGTINIVGGESGETNGDTINWSGVADVSSLVITNSDDVNGGLSGTFTLLDGTVVTFSEIENIVCFASNTEILTPHGKRQIKDLKFGDLVITRDNGLQPIRWIGTRTVPALNRFAPIRFEAGSLPNLDQPLLVSPQHRMLIGNHRSELYLGEREVLASAKHMVNGATITRQVGGEVTYMHMLFDQHEIVYANGTAAESFHPADMSLNAISDAAREEVFSLFPQLRENPAAYGDTARKCLRKHETVLVAA